MRFSKNLLDSARFYEILKRFCEILRDSVRFCARLCKILQDSGRFWKILQDSARFCARLCKILQDSGRLWKILQDSVRFWTIFSVTRYKMKIWTGLRSNLDKFDPFLLNSGVFSKIFGSFWTNFAFSVFPEVQNSLKIAKFSKKAKIPWFVSKNLWNDYKLMTVFGKLCLYGQDFVRFYEILLDFARFCARFC